MEQNTALQTLVQAVQVATKRGAFELAETPVIAEAVAVFTKKEEEPVKETKKKK